MRKLVIASTNLGKLREFEALLSDIDIKIESLLDYPEIGEIEETGKTFYENALIKAKTVAEHTKTLTLADDSGLVVPYLNGEPGVYSARYAGEPKDDLKNNQKLLKELEGVALENRVAQFECAIVLVDDKGYHEQVQGILKGRILEAVQGANGFGYDPLFYLDAYQKTTAELELDEKNKISHRGKAVAQVIPLIKAYFE